MSREVAQDLWWVAVGVLASNLSPSTIHPIVLVLCGVYAASVVGESKIPVSAFAQALVILCAAGHLRGLP